MRKNKNNLFIRIITTPYRAICKAKDLYIRSIIDCANHTTTYGMAPMTYGDTLSRTSSTSSFASRNAADEDFRELIRANSTARMGGLNVTRADLELYVKQHAMGSRRVPRSASVGMGKIDEDAPVIGFPGDEGLGRKRDRSMFLRSRSHDVTSSDKFNRFS